MRRLAQTEICRLPVQRLVIIRIVDESVEGWVERIDIIHIGLLRHFSARQMNGRIHDKTSKIFVNEINRRFPDKKIILTCASNEREKSKMSALLATLDFQPWRVFPGNLDLLELAALVKASCLHIGGDSGGLHVAWMTGTPTVTWFRRYDGLADWRPVGNQHRDVVGERAPSGLEGIEISGLLARIEELLTHSTPRSS